MKKIEVIHVAPRDTDKPEVETGLEADLDEAEDADEPEPNVAKLADADGDPEETSGEPPASKKTSEGDVADEGSEQLPEPGSASGTASERTPESTDKEREEAEPTKPAGPTVVVTMPGFRVFSDGSSRVYVRVSGRAKIVEKKDEGQLRYHLTGVTVPERVNRMVLPTGHFGTPVAKAFVAQVEGGADLVIVLRETVTGVVRLKKRGRGVVLSVDFPKQRKKAEEEKDPLADAG